MKKIIFSLLLMMLQYQSFSQIKYIDPTRVFSKISSAMADDGNIIVTLVIELSSDNTNSNMVTSDKLNLGTPNLKFKLYHVDNNSSNIILKEGVASERLNHFNTETIAFKITSKDAKLPENNLNQNNAWKQIDFFVEYTLDGKIRKTEEIVLFRRLMPVVGDPNPSIQSLIYDQISKSVQATVSVGVTGTSLNSTELLNSNDQVISSIGFKGSPAGDPLKLEFKIADIPATNANYKVKLKYNDGGATKTKVTQVYSLNILEPAKLQSGYPRIYLKGSFTAIQNKYINIFDNKNIDIEAIAVRGEQLKWSLIPQHITDNNVAALRFVNTSDINFDSRNQTTIPINNVPDGIYTLRIGAVSEGQRSISEITIQKNTQLVMRDFSVTYQKDKLDFSFSTDEQADVNKIKIKSVKGYPSLAILNPSKPNSYTCTFTSAMFDASEKIEGSTPTIEFSYDEKKFFNFGITVKSAAVVESKLQRIVNELKINTDILKPKEYDNIRNSVLKTLRSENIIKDLSSGEVAEESKEFTLNSIADGLVDAGREAKTNNGSSKFLNTLKVIGTTALKVFGTILL